MNIERREHRRFRVKNNAFTVINPDPVKLVPILDIGMGGLGFYLDNGAQWLKESSKLEIMVADCSFYLENLPFQIISKFKAFPADASNLIDGRRYGLKFGNLRPSQKSHLKYFIRNYTERSTILHFLQNFSKLLQPIWANKYSSQSCNTKIWQGLQRPSL